MTRAELARTCSVTPASVTGWENSTATPSTGRILEVAEALRFPVGYFTETEQPYPDKSEVSFRSMARIKARSRDAVRAAFSIADSIDDWIRHRYKLPLEDVPDLSEMDPETAARTLRTMWALGSRPIKNLVHLLELHGVRVFSLDEDGPEVDACSAWYEGKPFVLLNTQKSGERSRFDAAHELGHLVLHCGAMPDARTAESEANLFASALLMPRDELDAALPGGHCGVGDLLRIKGGWNTSVAAINYRGHQIGAISGTDYRQNCKTIARLGYRTSEPDPISRERSQVLEKVLGLWRKAGGTRFDIARDLSLPEDELDSLMFGLALTSRPPNPVRPVPTKLDKSSRKHPLRSLASDR